MIEMLTYEGEPAAVPAFRIMAIISGNIHAEPTRAALNKAYGLFEERYGEAANVTSYHFPGHTGKIRWINPKLDKQGKAFFKRDATEYGQGLRRYGYALQAFEEPALPYFGVEQRSDLCFFEIDISADDSGAVAFADEITSLLMNAGAIWGVMGMGFFLPPYKSSLEFILGRNSSRYRTSIDITPSMVTDGLRQEGSAYRWQAGEEPGIPDLGWRTLIGREFWRRIEDALPRLRSEKDVTVEQSEQVLAITAGSRPIWGDVERGDDISAYRNIARHLSPMRHPIGAAKAFMFGGDTHDPAHCDWVDAYMQRFS